MGFDFLETPMKVEDVVYLAESLSEFFDNINLEGRDLVESARIARSRVAKLPKDSVVRRNLEETVKNVLSGGKVVSWCQDLYPTG